MIPATIPSVPVNVTATSTESQGAIVSWDVPPSDGGSSILNYTVTSTPGSIAATTTQTTLSLSGLTNGVTYTFTVWGTNSVGTGPVSAASNSVTPAALPNAPTGITATSGDKQVYLSWDISDGNGAAVIYYTITSSLGIAATTTDNSFTVIGLENGTSYSFTSVSYTHLTLPTKA